MKNNKNNQKEKNCGNKNCSDKQGENQGKNKDFSRGGNN